MTGKGLLAIVEGVATKTLENLDISGNNVVTSNDGGRLFVAALCVRCVALQRLALGSCRGLKVGAFEAVLAFGGNVLEGSHDEPKLQSIQWLDVSNLDGGSGGRRRRQRSSSATLFSDSVEIDSASESLTTAVVSDNGMSEMDLEGVLLCVHKRLQSINFENCVQMTDDALRSLCHKRTSWGHVAHSGSVRVHTISLRGCSSLSDVAIGWISTGCPNVEVRACVVLFRVVFFFFLIFLIFLIF